MLPQKWEVVRVWCPHLLPPHDKFCVTIDAAAGIFFFINSNPPPFRKAKELAVTISNFEAVFLGHTSYVDTTTVEIFDPADIETAYADPERQHGLLIGAVKERIRQAVASHGALPDAVKAIVLAV